MMISRLSIFLSACPTEGAQQIIVSLTFELLAVEMKKKKHIILPCYALLTCGICSSTVLITMFYNY